jgi:hypothetical protein
VSTKDPAKKSGETVARDVALARLQEPGGAALTALAALVVNETTATPVAQIASPRWLASQIVAATEAATRGDPLRAWVERMLERERGRWADDDRPVRAFMPPEAEEPLRALLGRQTVPSEELVLRIIDQAALRGLVKSVLTDSLQRWRKKVGDVDKGLLGGIGKRAADRGRGLFGGLGGMAENLVGAVREEVENTFDVRVTDVAGATTHEAMRGIARYIADPDHAAAFAEMRLSVLDVLLDTPVADLVAEADKMGPEEAVSVVMGALSAAVQGDDVVDRLEARIASVLEEAGDGTFGAWLDEVEMRAVWSDTTTELVADRLKAVVGTDGFVTWWSELFKP